jgi:hypothetical protein
MDVDTLDAIRVYVEHVSVDPLCFDEPGHEFPAW